MTQYYEKRIISFGYPEGFEREELESLEIDECQILPKSQEKPSRSTRILDKLTEKAKFNNRYFETSHSVEKNKQEAHRKPTGYYKF